MALVGRRAIKLKPCFFVGLGGISTGFCLGREEEKFYNVLKKVGALKGEMGAWSYSCCFKGLVQ